eukprot:28706_1
MTDSNTPYIPTLIALVLGLTIVFLFFCQQKQQNKSKLSKPTNEIGPKQLPKQVKRKADEGKKEEEEDQDEYNDETLKQLQEQNAAKLSEKRKGMRENELVADLN